LVLDILHKLEEITTHSLNYKEMLCSLFTFFVVLVAKTAAFELNPHNQANFLDCPLPPKKRL